MALSFLAMPEATLLLMDWTISVLLIQSSFQLLVMQADQLQQDDNILTSSHLSFDHRRQLHHGLQSAAA
ncbi:hypothetical protein ATY81_08040 [Rhizobium sp. R72]|nr:hypothetical protein ATY81_08040 [Rhizobium sp. R72]OWV97716.1 hypothetical protein ATY80_08040 [Rhizobium sp. R711]